MDTTKTDSAEQLNKILPCISIDTIEELISRDLLHVEGDQWLGDDSNGTTRSLAGTNSNGAILTAKRGIDLLGWPM